MKDKLLNYIKNSFLKELLSNNNITDISYNGESLFYQDNRYGRKKSSIELSSLEASDFIRQIANLNESLFSYASPILDISVDRYRINATHSSITKCNNEKAISFSIRIASLKPRITKGGDFITPEVEDFLERMISKKISIIIGGKTGVGKTELQKYLLSLVEDYGRIIVIDNVSELETIRVNPNLDITYWQVNEENKFAKFESLIKNATRNNPDWLVVAEARGEEMSSVINSAMSGHPIITTIHSKEVETMPYRMSRLALINNKQETFEDIMYEVKTHFPVYIYLDKITINKEIKRYIKSIGEYVNNHMNIIFDKDIGFMKDNISLPLKRELGYR